MRKKCAKARNEQSDVSCKQNRLLLVVPSPGSDLSYVRMIKYVVENSLHVRTYLATYVATVVESRNHPPTRRSTMVRDLKKYAGSL